MKSGDPDRIRKHIRSLEKNAENVIESVISLVYFMRGGVTWDEMMSRTPGERDAISRFIKKRLDAQKDSMHPVY